jgi:hypothetical protein
MTELRTVGADDWQTMRDIRLDALREVAFPEQTWRERATSGNSIVAHLPEFDREPVGLVASIQETPGQPALMELALARAVTP